ncbi:hypothetical protein NDU88_003659 [Pleurodeles waltl]|uniref:ALMS motif domain-containing protein n=1 Tax=Pleurodeles waltl TaxID=8319 RepID=A0AAV7MS96_PLEWA|nr:hypothetical protein NDU88_003659 [Pleurodeles waltl]
MEEPLEDSGEIPQKKIGLTKACLHVGVEVDDNRAQAAKAEHSSGLEKPLGDQRHDLKSPSSNGSECKSDCCQVEDTLAFLSSHMKELQILVPDDPSKQALQTPVGHPGNFFTFQQRWDGIPFKPSPVDPPSSDQSWGHTSKKVAKSVTWWSSSKPCLTTILEHEKKRPLRRGRTQAWQEGDRVEKQNQDWPTLLSSKIPTQFMMKIPDKDDRKDSNKKRQMWILAIENHFKDLNRAPSHPSLVDAGAEGQVEHAVNAAHVGQKTDSNEKTVSNQDTECKRKGQPPSMEPTLLNSSSPTKSMWILPSWKQRCRQTSEDELTFQPAIHKTIPNFDILHRKFQKALEKTRIKRNVTQCKPFQLQTSNTKAFYTQHVLMENDTHSKDKHCIRRERQHGPHRKYDTSQALPSTNKTFEKRQAAIRQWLLEAGKLDQEKKDVEERRKRKAQRIRRRVQKCLAVRGVLLSKKEELNRKLQDFRQQNEEREAEYQAALREMQARVNQRPFLFQQVTQVP